MVNVINYTICENTEGEEFIALIILCGLEMVKSKKSGRLQAIIRTISIPTALDEATAQGLVEQKILGRIKKTPCEPYEYTHPKTGERIESSFRYRYYNPIINN